MKRNVLLTCVRAMAFRRWPGPNAKFDLRTHILLAGTAERLEAFWAPGFARMCPPEYDPESLERGNFICNTHKQTLDPRYDPSTSAISGHRILRLFSEVVLVEQATYHAGFL